MSFFDAAIDSIGSAGVWLGALIGCVVLLYPGVGPQSAAARSARLWIALRRSVSSVLLVWAVILFIGILNGPTPAATPQSSPSQSQSATPKTNPSSPLPSAGPTLQPAQQTASVALSNGSSSAGSTTAVLDLTDRGAAQKHTVTSMLYAVFFVVSTILLFATKITYDNIADVRALKEKAEKKKKQDDEDFARDRREIQRVRRRIELFEELFELDRKARSGLSPTEHKRFQSIFLIRDIYRGPSRISMPADLGLDGLLEREELRQELALEDWAYLEWMCRSFEHWNPSTQKEVRAAAGHLYARRPD